MSCNKGVSRVKISELLELAEGLRDVVTSTSYGTEDGMCSSECNFGGGNSGAAMPDGTLVFPTISGVVLIDPSEESGVKEGKLTVGYGAGGREPKIGPELSFGITMQQHVGEPILLIKTSWGGKSLNTDFRSPSAGPRSRHRRRQ